MKVLEQYRTKQMVRSFILRSFVADIFEHGDYGQRMC